MANEKLSANAELTATKPDNKGKLSLKVDLPENGDLVVCKVCGHKNSKDAGLCAMCSNYLFD